MRQKNIYIIGRICCIEGFKDNIERGYHLSARQTSTDALEAETRLLESLYRRLTKRMLQDYKSQPHNIRKILRLFTAQAIRHSIDDLREWK